MFIDQVTLGHRRSDERTTKNLFCYCLVELIKYMDGQTSQICMLL